MPLQEKVYLFCIVQKFLLNYERTPYFLEQKNSFPFLLPVHDQCRSGILKLYFFSWVKVKLSNRSFVWNIWCPRFNHSTINMSKFGISQQHEFILCLVTLEYFLSLFAICLFFVTIPLFLSSFGNWLTHFLWWILSHFYKSFEGYGVICWLISLFNPSDIYFILWELPCLLLRNQFIMFPCIWWAIFLWLLSTCFFFSCVSYEIISTGLRNGPAGKSLSTHAQVLVFNFQNPVNAGRAKCPICNSSLGRYRQRILRASWVAKWTV